MNDLTQLIESIAPSIVRVEARRGYPLSGVVWSEGIIITTNRAIENEEAIHIANDDKDYGATLVGRDPRTDIAVLRTEAKLLLPNWQTEQNLKLGQWLVRVGRPAKMQVTLGVLSYLAGPWRTPWGGRIDATLETDAKPFPGFSGAAVVTAAGEVIGISTAALNRSGDAIIPTGTLQRVVAAILAHGHVRRGYLGIATQPVRLPESQLEQHTGLLITSVEADSPAAKSGLTLGDTILIFNGLAVQRASDLMAALEDSALKAVSATILRGGVVQEIQVIAGER